MPYLQSKRGIFCNIPANIKPSINAEALSPPQRPALSVSISDFRFRCFPCCNRAFQRIPPPRAVHTAAMIYQSHCCGSMAPRRLVVLVVCLHVAIASAFVFESSPTNHAHRGTSISRKGMIGTAYVVPTGRGQGGLTNTRSTRHRSTTCSLSGQSRDAKSGFSPRRCRGQAYRCAMFNSGASRRVLGQGSSCDGSQRRAARLGKTAISSMRIGVEDVDEGLRERDHAVGGVEDKGGEGAPSASMMSTESGKTSKGWEYWSYRALLLGVAAIWGTNFPVVRDHVVILLSSSVLVGLWRHLTSLVASPRVTRTCS